EHIALEGISETPETNNAIPDTNKINSTVLFIISVLNNYYTALTSDKGNIEKVKCVTQFF
ncbi:MAG: hypothetical protein ACM31G_02165, partial [Flavobacteriales bacterium]